MYASFLSLFFFCLLLFLQLCSIPQVHGKMKHPCDPNGAPLRPNPPPAARKLTQYNGLISPELFMGKSADQKKTVKKLVWLVPKAGSSTLRHIMKTQFHLRLGVLPGGPNVAKQVPLAKQQMRLNHIDAGGSNFLYHLMNIPDNDTEVILLSLFRDPVETKKSLFEYRRVAPAGESFPFCHGLNSVEAWLKTNFSTTNYICSSICGKPASQLTMEDLPFAKSIISKMFVMVLSEIDDGFKMLQRVFGWERSGNSVPKKNAKKKQQFVFTEKDSELIREANWCDVELYDAIKDRYAKLKAAV